MSLTFAVVRGALSQNVQRDAGTNASGNKLVKQEIARMGILPYPEFWAGSTHRGTPGHALLLHFIFTSVVILAAPLSNANGFLVVSTLYPYARNYIACKSSYVC
jgi:hypothetical protein